nr:hypothetical protein [Candidatus Woesearchaeota archaeon]
MRDKVLKILKDSIKKFKEIKKIELIAIFGSILSKRNSNFKDLDIISISDKNTNKKFISHLKKNLNDNGFKTIIFETITKKPKKREEKIFIHNLNYISLSDLLKREWKSVINTMKSDMVILHGDKNFKNKLPSYKVSKKELLNPIKSWSKKISNEEEFKNFKDYLTKITPRLLKDYNY